MLGYLDRPSVTARAVDAEGWLHTGDVGELDEAGRLRITGRRKNLLVLSTGKNVAPAPIEDAVRASALVHQAVLLGDGRDATALLVAPATGALDGHPDAATSIRAEVERLTASFAAYERPRRVGLLPRPLSRERGEIDASGRPVRAAVVAAFPNEVAELFERPGRDTGPAASPERRADAATDQRREPTASPSG
jgi:long-chain acyl-CoA synthetase